ncbi:terminase small subunit [Burkholderia cenocepacia]|uniref:terminase small subunit n=1 Tax=Burkholderia cenocepacia TaxID=95486 RepID=UPI0022303B66|nr:terminase small subunit [Burkholderia cenocepacia]MCW3657556.1 terminase small subunit [Burkholderia cenocepacia]
MSKLSAQQQRFVDEYLVDLNATQAAIRAGYSKKTARSQGNRLLTNVDVSKAITERKRARAERVQIDADEVLAKVHAVAFADTNGIVSFRRECCRYCWGNGHAYQYKTQREFDEAARRFQRELAAAKKSKVPKAALPTFDASGGLGFQPSREPHPNCPECDGEGFGRVFIGDTRRLPPELIALYGGVKHTKEGIEVILHPQDRARELLMRHLGLLKEEVRVTVTDELAARLAAARKRRANGQAGGS